MREADAQFVAQAIGRERLFGVLWKLGVAVGAGMAGFALYRGLAGENWGTTFVLAIFVLLNARGNLRQVRYARILRVLTAPELLHPE